MAEGDAALEPTLCYSSAFPSYRLRTVTKYTAARIPESSLTVSSLQSLH